MNLMQLAPQAVDMLLAVVLVIELWLHQRVSIDRCGQGMTDFMGLSGEMLSIAIQPNLHYGSADIAHLKSD